MELVHEKKPYFLIDKDCRCPALPNRYLATLSARATTTLRSYGYALCHWLQYCEDHRIDWRSAGQGAVLQYRQTLTGCHEGRNFRIGRLRAFYEWCQPHGIPNPLERLVRQPRLLYFPVQYKEVRLVPVSGVAKFMRALSERDRLIARLMLFCGLRRSEALSLPRSLLSGQGGDDGVPFTVRGKGDKTRTLRLPGVLQRELAAWAETQPASVWLFHRNGAPLCPDTIGVAFRKARMATGVPIHPHLLRHIFATRRLAQEEKRVGHRGMNAALKIVQMELGHASLTTTARYLHMMNPDSVADCYGDFVRQMTKDLVEGAA
jgi:integrase